MNQNKSPLLTIGIPLHRSRPFVDVVSANIEAVDREDVEFLLSDRTGLDDAADVLAARHSADYRVAVVRKVDGSNWVDHCNALLRQARGTYFCWMPHDDSFPREWVDTLLGCLEAEPDLLMAFGRIEPVATDETRAEIERYSHPAVGAGTGTWTVYDAVVVLTQWIGGYAFRGMFRRETVVAHGLFLPRTRDRHRRGRGVGVRYGAARSTPLRAGGCLFKTVLRGVRAQCFASWYGAPPFVGLGSSLLRDPV